MMAIVMALVAVAAAPVVHAPAPIDDTSFVASDGTRTMRFSVFVRANPQRLWWAVATEKGWKTWAVKSAFVDFRQGGIIETSYRNGVVRGDRDNIRNLIIDYVPQQMLVFRNIQAPRKFPADAERFSRIISSIKLDPTDGGTIVTLSGAGYAADPEYDQLYRFFSQGNRYSLEQLRASVEGSKRQH